MTTAKPQMSDEAVKKGSGKTWPEWVEILDAWGAAERTHKEIAQHVHDLGVGDWWAQGVTVGYERIKGLRAYGQASSGKFQGSASKTFPVSVDVLFAAWVEDSERARWLAARTLVIRTSRPGSSARFDIAGGGVLAASFVDKGSGKSSVQVQNDNLDSREAALAFRETWKAHLADLAAHLMG